MNNYYLILEFKNAGLFRANKGSKDISFEDGFREPRSNKETFVEPITAQQISNMLHVLFGKRPKPINRYTFYEKNVKLYEKALDSYIKIDSYKNKKGYYYEEFIQTKVIIYNSSRNSSYMNWERVKKLLEDELFDVFTSTFNKVFNIDYKTITFNEAKKLFISKKDIRLNEMFILLKNKNKNSLFQSIYGSGSQLSEINKNKRTFLGVFMDISKIQRLSGEIMIPISEEDMEIIRKNKGCATLLDGGVVTIKEFIHKNKIDFEGFIKVSEISLEMK